MYSPTFEKSIDVHSKKNYPSDLADWWTTQKNETYQLFADWAHANRDNIVLTYGYTALGVGFGTAMEIGAGYVDLLKFGRGVWRGSLAGVGSDALRLVSIAGPSAGKAVLAGGAKMSRLYTNIHPERPVCAYVSTAQVLRHSGNKLFASFDDIVRASGASLDDVMAGARTSINQGIRGRQSEVIAYTFSKFGVLAKPVLVAGGVPYQAVIERLSNILKQAPLGTVMPITLRLVNQEGRRISHMAYLYMSKGAVHVMDRRGSYALFNLGALASFYEAKNMFIRGAALVYAPGFIRYGKELALALPVYRQFVGSLFQLSSSYNIWKATRSPGWFGATNALSPILPNMSTPPPSQNQSLRRHYTTSIGDSLWSVAHTYLGAGMNWPQLYRRNQSVIGRDPARLKPGTRLMLR